MMFPRFTFFFVGIFFIILPVSAFAQDVKLLILGDSLSAGYGLTQEESWPYLLQNTWQSQNIQVINAAVSGETSRGGLSRLPRLIELHQPSHLLIELGGNDGLRGYSIADMQENIEKIIQLATNNDVTVLLQEMKIPSNFGRRYTQMFTESFPQIADKHDIPLIPFLLEDVALKQELMQSDGIHPNKTAQPLIADFMQQQLEPILLGNN
jgi:acyl-CoA thioesterase-1